MGSQYKLLSELLSDQAAFITSPKISLANYWGEHYPPCPPVSTGFYLLKVVASALYCRHGLGVNGNRNSY